MKEVMSMEDRYLFKAKRVDNGEWVQGYYVKGLDVFENCEEAHIIFQPNTMFYSGGETDGWYEVDPATICQCTGLKDKNGKLIWENDIMVGRLDENYPEYKTYIKFDGVKMDFAPSKMGAKIYHQLTNLTKSILKCVATFLTIQSY